MAQALLLLAAGLGAVAAAHSADQPNAKSERKGTVVGVATAPAAWKKLFDGKTLTGWKETNFGGQGEVTVEGGAIVMERGNDMTGVTYAGNDFPKMDYEVVVESKRVKGNDFFSTITFPVGDSHCSLVTGGWGGTVVGLSCIDFRDASDNETTTLQNFKDGQWYRFRVRVTKDRIQAWIDEKQVVDQEIKDKKISVRAECDLCRPFGLATWRTTGAVRDVRVRLLTAEEKNPIAKTRKDEDARK